MRRIIVTLFAVVAGITVGCLWQSTPLGEHLADGWRHTANGWERMANWPSLAKRLPHPAIISAFLVLLSVFALTAIPSPATRLYCDRGRDRRQPPMYWPADRERRQNSLRRRSEILSKT